MLARHVARAFGRADAFLIAGPREWLRRRRWSRRESDLQGEPRDALYASIWRAAADELGLEVHPLGDGVLELRNGTRRTRVWQQVTTLDDPVTLRMALDKRLTRHLLSDAGVPVPEQVAFDVAHPGPAFAFRRSAPGPFVVKPAAGTGGGLAITGAVRSPLDLARAITVAARVSDELLIEAEVPGDVYRMLVVDGELVDVVRQRRPTVIGDGRATVLELLDRENRRRWNAQGEEGLSFMSARLDTVFSLREAGLRLRSVPAAGRRVVVQTVTNDYRIEDAETYRGPLCHELVDDVRTAAGALGLRYAGVDVITPDPTQPLRSVGGAIPEVNGTPGLHHHRLVADRSAAAPVAVAVLRRLFEP